MRKIKDVLRLRHELGLGQRQIARSCSIGQATVAEYLKRAKAAGIGWPLPDGWDDAQLEKAVFGSPEPPPVARKGKPLPDFAEVREQLQRHRDLTLQLIWEEYRQKHSDGYSYSYFCDRYEHWRGKQDVVLRQEHRPGEKMFVDWAGATIAIHHAHGGITQAPLFVSALGVSSYTYAELTPNQQMEHWLKVQMHAFEFYGGCPQLLVPDNTKTGVIKACRYEPDLNPTYQEFATHYHVAVLPARPNKPRDKAKVESVVQVVQRWIVMRLRHRKFFSIAEANQAIWELLEPLNRRPFRKRRAESRSSLFEKIDRPALQPLPAERYDLSHWAQARVNIDYHVAFDGDWYSVPYTLTGELVDVRATPATIEIFHRGQRIASHLRHRGRNQSVTHAEHRPKSHQAHLEWTPSRIVNWAAKVGPHTAQLVQRILEDKPHPEMGYRSCLGLIRLAAKHSSARMEAAAERALVTGAVGYQRVKSILERKLDAQPLSPPPEIRPSPRHENLRGPEYFSKETTPMLHNPTLEKLESLRLHGTAQALREQTKDERHREPSFEERFALLVDRQVTWRQNEAMQARLRRAKLRNNACVENIDFRSSRGLDKALMRSLIQESAWVASTRTSSCAAPPESARVTWPAPWRIRPVATATRRSMRVRRLCFAISRWRARTAACAACYCG